MADEVDFEPEYDEEQPMDEEEHGGEGGGEVEPRAAEEVGNGGATAGPKSGKGRRSSTKGRGHQNASIEEDRRVERDRGLLALNSIC